MALEPDSVTIYQMELPFNTTISKDLLKRTDQLTGSLADWATKRRWVEEAFEALERAGYHVGSAYTAVKDPSRTRFVYRDRLWQGADMAGLGVASFGHVNGVHMQNRGHLGDLQRGDRRRRRCRSAAPTVRRRRSACAASWCCSSSSGTLEPAYFRASTRRHPEAVRDQFESLTAEGYLARASEAVIELSRDGLMRVDALLPRFFLPAAHRDSLHLGPRLRRRTAADEASSVRIPPQRRVQFYETDAAGIVHFSCSSATWRRPSTRSGARRG